MVVISSLSVVANELRTLFEREIVDIDVAHIRIGHPKHTFEDMTDNENFLNLFFYNVRYDGYPADGLSEDPFYVRLYCLITPVGAKNGTPSAGENDLRLVGEVMRVLHEYPMISVVGGDNVEVAQLQVVPHPLDLDNLNHIWSTQGDTAYRLSVAYEMALAPIPLAVAAERSPLVGETGTRIRPRMNRDALPDSGFGIPTSSPTVPEIKVDASRSDWTPHVCMVYQDGCAYTLAFKEGSQSLMDFQPHIWVASDIGARIDLVWEKWQSDTGWQVVSRRRNIFSFAAAIDFGSTNMYAGTKSGGVFKSVDSGENWQQRNTGLSDQNVQILAIDPDSPAILYAGTHGGGVFKSLDSGENWQQKNEGLSDQNVQTLAIDPDRPATLYAGTHGGGVFKSRNGADEWRQENNGLDNLNIQVLAIDPDRPANLYAGTYGGGVFRSNNGGERWRQENDGLDSLNVLSLAIDPDSPATLYAATWGDGVFKSINSGENWQKKNKGLGDLYTQILAIDPTTPATLYAGTHRGGVFKSIDSGDSWEKKNVGLDNLDIQFLAVDPAEPTTVYAGANGGGVFKSEDGAETWRQLSRIPVGLNDNPLTINPEMADSAQTVQETMPDKSILGQSMLYAVRTYMSIRDGKFVEARSNPLLISVYGAVA